MKTLHLGGLSRRPLSVVCLSAVVAFALGFTMTVISGSDGYVFLLLSAAVLVLAGGSVGTAIRAMPREDLDIEIVLFLIPSAVLGAVLFFFIVGSYIAGLSVPYALALVEWNEQDTDWAGWIIVLLIGAGLLAVIVGGPVGIVAWASRLVGRRQR